MPCSWPSPSVRLNRHGLGWQGSRPMLANHRPGPAPVRRARPGSSGPRAPAGTGTCHPNPRKTSGRTTRAAGAFLPSPIPAYLCSLKTRTGETPDPGAHFHDRRHICSSIRGRRVLLVDELGLSVTDDLWKVRRLFRKSFLHLQFRFSRSTSRSHAGSFTVTGGSSPACSRRICQFNSQGASLGPSSFATRAIGRDVSTTIFTASSLNSGEKLFFGRGNYFTFPDIHPEWTDCPEASGHLSPAFPIRWFGSLLLLLVAAVGCVGWARARGRR